MLPTPASSDEAPPPPPPRAHEWWRCETPELFKDPPADAASWERHATWVRHLPNPGVCLRVLRCLSPLVAWSCAVATGVCLYAELVQGKNGWPVAASSDYLAPFQLTSFAVSLLLVFRTNAAYGRWWEARRAVGLWLNAARSTARLALHLIPPDEPHLAAAALRWCAALMPAAAAHVCGDAAYWRHCSGGGPTALTRAEREWAAASACPPLAAAQAISALVARARVGDVGCAAVEAQLSEFDIAVGACERISRQPIPLAYTRHTSRFIVTFLTFLPFALEELLSWLTIPTMGVLTFLLVGIENIGIQIEEPFRVLPMHAMAVGGAAAVAAIAAEADGARALAAAVGPGGDKLAPPPPAGPMSQ